jgi:hypothetical protein
MKMRRLPDTKAREDIPMWELDLNDDAAAPDPSPRQILYAEQARRELAALKKTLERLTVPQQRSIIREIAGTVYRRDVTPAGYGSRELA